MVAWTVNLPATRNRASPDPWADMNTMVDATEEIREAVDAGGGGTTIKDLKLVALTAHAQNREFRADADLTGAVRVDNSTNNAAAQARATWTRQGDSLVVVLDGRTTVDAAGEMHGHVWPYALAVGEAVQTYARFTGPAASFPFGGLVVCDGTTYGSGNQVFWSIWHSTSVTDGNFQDGLWTGWNTRASFTDRSTLDVYGRDLHQRLLRDTGNVWRYQVSSDGAYWHEIANRTLAMTPSHIGFAAGQWGHTARHSFSFDYLRVT